MNTCICSLDGNPLNLEAMNKTLARIYQSGTFSFWSDHEFITHARTHELNISLPFSELFTWFIN